MSSALVWAMGLLATFCVILGQFVFPFAFDFVSTLAVYGVGVYAGAAIRK